MNTFCELPLRIQMARQNKLIDLICTSILSFMLNVSTRKFIVYYN